MVARSLLSSAGTWPMPEREGRERKRMGEMDFRKTSDRQIVEKEKKEQVCCVKTTHSQRNSRGTGPRRAP